MDPYFAKNFITQSALVMIRLFSRFCSEILQIVFNIFRNVLIVPMQLGARLTRRRI